MALKTKATTIQDLRQQAKKIVDQMTLEEKVFQTLHSAAPIERLGIKGYNWWNEALHGVARAGVATVFPQAIGLAATFDENLIEKVADVISTEGRAKYKMQSKHDDRDIYKGLTFWSPNVNIFRDPRWGRGHETFGEDPYLSSRLGVRFVEGIQGHDDTYLKAAACAKHFAVHSGPEEDRHHFDAVVSKQDLYETYLPAFKACVQEGKVEAVMGAYNRTNGEPCCGSHTLLKDILRAEWGFEGHVVSDCWAIKDFHMNHHVTKTPVESVALAMNNGCDLNCGNMFIYLKEAVERGMVSEERLSEAVTNLYVSKMKLGLLGQEGKTPYEDIDYDLVDTRENQEFNEKVAEKTLVLLKNQDQILPLNIKEIKTIGVIGPNANNRKALIGNYEGTASRYVTVSEGIQDYVGQEAKVIFSEGCHLYKDRVSGLSERSDREAELREVCERSDVVIACMGLDSGLEGEEGDEGNEFASGDKPNLNLPGIQEEVLEIIASYGKPLVLVLLSGSALSITWADKHIPAIVQGWYPGALGGKAIANLLFGKAVPEGKLPVTFYKTSEELPPMTDYAMKNRTYRYMKQDALYPFGYGLSYTHFELTKVGLDKDQLESDEGVTVRATLTNTGNFSGSETIQVYVKYDEMQTPNAQLKGLKKISLEPQTSKTVSINLPKKSFGLYDQEGEFVIGEGTYSVYVGTHQPDKRSLELTGQQVETLKVEYRRQES